MMRQIAIKLYSYAVTVETKLFNIFYNFLLSAFSFRLFARMAKDGHGSNKCLEYGFLPVPVHFYSPIPDIKDLQKRKIWDKKSALCGIDFYALSQLALLKKLGKKYGNECSWSLHPTSNSGEFYIDNQGFSYGCASALHTIIREFMPKRIIEIGSGNSSQVIAQAININLKKEQHKTKYLIVDPYPAEFVKKRLINYHKLLAKRVEFLKPEFFDQLKKNDILFIDSSHTSKIGSDVNFLYLEVLPRLKPGVIIHIHDINLPYEYPKAYAVNEVFRQFWTEQYLLQAFLIGNRDFEILLAMGYLMNDHSKDFQRAFPNYNPKIHLFKSGSFWLRRKVKQ